MKLFYSLGRTINLGNFESVKFEYGVEVEGDNRSELLADAKEFVEEVVAQETSFWKTRRKQSKA
jgi:hypothetical protein